MVNHQFMKRRTYLINKQFQFRYTLLSCIVILMIAFAYAAMAVYTTNQIIGDVLISGRETSLREISILHLKQLFKLMLPFTAVIFIAGVYLTHRIAGPAYRIVMDLGEIGGGNLNKRVHLRKNDELHEVAEAINQAVADLRILVHHDRKQIEAIIQELQEIERDGSPSSLTGVQEKIRGLTRGFELGTPTGPAQVPTRAIH